MAVDVAKQCAALLIEQRMSFLRPMDDQAVLSLAANREERGKLDPISVHLVLAGVASGKYKDIQSGLDAIGAGVWPSRVLKDGYWPRKVSKDAFQPVPCPSNCPSGFDYIPYFSLLESK